LLQLKHGAQLPELRVTNTLAALESLRRTERLAREAHDDLIAGLVFLRKIENRLRLMHDRALNELPSEMGALNKLALRLGMQAADGGTRVLYVTSEQFMNAFIDAISTGKQLEFRALYRNVDLLLIDDIQFFTGKERTQTEFFHTFNALYDAGKKIVVSSDRPPKEIKTLEERLRSRFEWGLIVDIQQPDLETRVAILRRKGESEGMDLPSEVTLFIAEHIRSNIRELEGSLLRVKAFAMMANREIDLSLAREVLGSLMVSEAASQRVTVDRIQEVVCEYFNVTDVELIGESRIKKYAFPRHVAQYLCRTLTELSFPEIGQRFGGRDHTSVMHAVRKVEKALAVDSHVKNIVSYLVRRVKEG